ncbi:MAG: hypothetical protein ACO280_12610 [Pseudohongiellaceae bacterium]
MRALRRYLLLLAAVTPVALWAAELPSAPGQTGSPGPASTTTGAGAGAVSPETGAEADQTPGTMTANDTFVPTVEISEDLSVSFPADI